MPYIIAKRVGDIILASIGVTLAAPLTGLALLAVWLQDFQSPLYWALRTGRRGIPFRMLKIRSMRVGADRQNIWATSTNDPRITRIGKVIRACKLDEIPQLWNVLRGQMSLVGPRPLATAETATFTDTERHILDITPGITDMASIVFADEGHLLEDSSDPTRDYDRMIRPWKSRLALLYVDKRSLRLDLCLLMITAIALLNRQVALRWLQRVMLSLQAEEALVRLAARRESIEPAAPPGIHE